MHITVTQYQGRGRLFSAGRFVAQTLYDVEIKTSQTGTATVIGRLEGASAALPEERMSGEYTLVLETGAKLTCTLQPLSAAGGYTITRYSLLEFPMPR